MSYKVVQARSCGLAELKLGYYSTQLPVCESESNISMAEGRNEPELGEYDYEFTCNVPDYWECLVCHLALKDPVQIEKCGHRLCSICMESLFR